MGGPWSEVLPFAIAAAVLVASVRPRYLRQAAPGWALLQRAGLLMLTAPLFLLLAVGLSSVPDLLNGRDLVPLSPELLAVKALVHLALYLALPAIGLVLILGPRRALASVPHQLAGGRPVGRALAAGLATAAIYSLTLTAALAFGWTILPDDAGLFAIEGARAFFSNTTPGVALALAGAAAVAEEVLFRGILLAHFRRSFSLHAAIWSQAALFGLIHAGYGSVVHVLAATAFGVLMGYLASKSGLVPAMVVHFVVNLVILAAWSSRAGGLVPLIGVCLAVLSTFWVWRAVKALDARGRAAQA